MNYLHLSHEPLDVDSINKIVVSENCGAISMFCGTTRNNFEGKPVVCLEYEAYEPMALKQMQIICNDIRQKWPDVVHIAIYHRLGVVPICKPSVVIAISSPHRQSSLQAVAFAIDELKKRVPIWKKEKYENNESTWKENKECKERFNYKENICVNEELEAVPKNLIQISAPEEEISRRIRCFLGKKREEINLSNILDYITKQPRVIETATGKNSRHVEDDGEVVSCARTNSIVIKQEYSSCHLRVSRAENRFGPQKRDYLDKLMTNRIDGKSIVKIEKDLDYTANMPQASTIPFGVLERLETVEEHLNLPKPDDKTIFQRLKSIENRLLHLESISPEYKHFLTQGPQSNSNTLHPDVGVIKAEPQLVLNQKKVCYTVNDIDSMIERIQSYTAPQLRDE